MIYVVSLRMVEFVKDDSVLLGFHLKPSLFNACEMCNKQQQQHCAQQYFIGNLVERQPATIFNYCFHCARHHVHVIIKAASLIKMQPSKSAIIHFFNLFCCTTVSEPS